MNLEARRPCNIRRTVSGSQCLWLSGLSAPLRLYRRWSSLAGPDVVRNGILETDVEIMAGAGVEAVAGDDLALQESIRRLRDAWR